VIASLVVVALVGPLLSPFDPARISPDRLQPPSWPHPLGTDQLGRDLLTRLLYGGRISLQVALLAVGVGCAAGVVIGVPSGYFGGKVDLVAMRAIDILQAFPGILLALALVATLGPNLQNAMLAVSLSAIPAYTRVARASVLVTKSLTYVEAARVVGGGPLRVMIHHILPNVLPPLVVLATTGAGLAVSASAALGFLGLGAPPPTPEWGTMLNDGRNFVRLAWWLGTFPGLAIMLMVFAANLLGDGLRDALDPRLKSG
jgi:ABC-type dipeptide/oligopeptide/nickel transport system permease subunit